MPEEYFSRVQETVLEVKPDRKPHRVASLGVFEFGKLMMYLNELPLTHGHNKGGKTFIHQF